MPIDMSMAKSTPPPKKRVSPAAAKKVEETNGTIRDRRFSGLIGLAQIGQALCLMMGQYADAATIEKLFPPIAKELSAVAETSDVIAKPIDFLMEVGPYGALITVTLPFLLQFGANHRMIPAAGLSNIGVVPPEVLEAEMKAGVARMQAEALRQQQEAIKMAQQAQAEYEEMAKG